MRFIAALLAFVLTSPLAPVPHAQAIKPRLVVLLIVDQMRADYVDRYRHQWDGGLARLLDEGAHFSHAAYPYANTVTCAGHSSVSTGTLPSVHGMAMNQWWDRDFGRVTACADDISSLVLSYGAPISAVGQSAANLRVPGLADQMRAQLTPPVRVAAFSLKARSAVTLGGQRPDAIAWVADEGAWVTSTAYPGGLVPEIADFISTHPVEHQLWSVWNRALPASTYLDESAAIGKRETDAAQFPHTLHSWDEWESSPLSDEYLASLALHVIKSMRFGQANHTDYLALSFSALDLVGHDYGPNSHEVQDVLIRLDRTLGTLLDELDKAVGKGLYTVALTSDHGVGSTPERLKAMNLDAGRVPATAIPGAAQAAISKVLGPGQWAGRLLGNDLYLRDGVFDELRRTDKGIARLRAALLEIPGVERVVMRHELADDDPYDPVLRKIANSFVPDRSGDLTVVLKPHWLIGQTNAANHGTVNDYDARVPLMLWGAGIRPGSYQRPVSPLDIAPTLACLTGIILPHAQGAVLAEALAVTSPPARPARRRAQAGA